MRAVGYHHARPIDDPNSLIDIEMPMPQPLPRDIVVRVAAVSVNPVDVKQRARAEPPEGSARVLGFDAAGTVTALGDDASHFRVGDEVFYAGAIDRPGTNAEYHAVDERLVSLRPRTISAAHAAALPLTALTAWELLFDRLAVPYGRKVASDALLIVNGAGGVGSMLTQLARRLTGLTVIATASRPETVAWCRTMGAHHVIDHHKPLDEGVTAIGIPQVRYVAGLTATDRHRDAIVAALAPQGALAMIDDPETFDVVPFKRKSLAVHWELMFTRSLFSTPDMAEQGRILSEIAALVDGGVLRTTFREDGGPLNAANLRKAHALVESGRSYGKTVLTGF